ncbi:sulfatase-like hydrolase/transferase [Halosolutus gelatinilyticus]|uniref:sulfatase-like hydrolase/transferase n=1 Tax=Halosolutus gelatinilyticus TaxID=2931975 RepID=UPI001FF233F1|nr:sulfatase-like hydrolase/transferase [Halosolutus gelatinilyticus]
MPDQPNVFVLSIDSLPYSRFEQSSRQLANRLDGVNFTDAIAPASFTSSSMPALVTGSHTDEISAWGLPKSGGPTPVAEEFTKAGYDCALWTDNYLFGTEYNYDRGFNAGNLGRPSRKKRVANRVKDGPLEPAFGFFETVYFNVVQPMQNVAGMSDSFYRTANELNERVLTWLEERRSNSPLFCWIHYMDTHHPYQPPSEYLDRRRFNDRRSRSELGEFTRNAIKSNGDDLTESELEDVQTAYAACCEYIHDELTALISTLENRGHYDPTSDVLVVTADHGEILNRDERDMLGHVPPAFWEDIVHVPLIIGHPRWSAANYDEQVSLLDLKRFLLEAAEVSRTTSIDPADLRRERAMMVSEWEEHDDGSITTFRGIRSAAGQKYFGARRKSTDQVLCTTVGDRSEDVIHATSATSSPIDVPVEYESLHEELVNRGGAVDERAVAATRERGAAEAHLRDLGYLD